LSDRIATQAAWKCHGCSRTFKGGGVHRTAATETDPVYRFCDNCWAKRPSAEPHGRDDVEARDGWVWLTALDAYGEDFVNALKPSYARELGAALIEAACEAERQS
jgi:hypothetical protein